MFSSCEKEGEAEPVRPVKAIQVAESASSFEGNLIFPGTLRAFKRAELSFRVDGTVVERNIHVGQSVKKDQVLIQLDPREYEIALQKADGKVESTKAQLSFALRDYDRMKNIYEKDPGAISQSLLDRKLESGNQLKAELSIAEGDLDKAKDDLSYTQLKAPFDGIVSAIYVENHEQVRAKQGAVRLIDSAEREMEINIPEKYISTLLGKAEKLNFAVHLDAFPGKTFTASVKEIGTEASSTTQTYPVTLTIENIPLELSLLAGMSGKAILEVPLKEGKFAKPVFKVPNSAVFTDDLNRTFVWVVDPSAHTVHKKGVTLSKSGQGDFSLIEKGLSPGDFVVTAGASFLSEGQKVKLAKEPARP